jgi:hypothetical protein
VGICLTDELPLATRVAAKTGHRQLFTFARSERLDVIFANRYLAALEAYQGGGRPTRSWLAAFEAATRGFNCGMAGTRSRVVRRLHPLPRSLREGVYEPRRGRGRAPRLSG